MLKSELGSNKLKSSAGWRLIPALGAAALLGSCMVGLDYVRPEAEAPDGYKEAGADWKPAEPQDHLPRGKWWELFNDPQLNVLEQQIELSNQTIAVAVSQYQQARALVQQARSAYFPTVTTSPSVTRSKASGTLGAVPTARAPITRYTLPVDVSWELDLWGRYRRAYESTEAAAQASAGDLESIRLTAQAELAQDYFQLRMLDAQKQLLEDTAIGYQRSLQLTRNRYTSGVASKADVAAAETQLRTTEAQAIDVGVQRAQMEHAIAILIGKPPSLFSLAPTPLADLPPPLPIGVPSALLERRPDVAAAERRVQAANAQIGVAIAAYYPSLTLGASAGFDTTDLSKWLTFPSRFWSVGPQLAETLFDAGLRRAQTDQARAAYDGTVATYRQTVLTGFQEVEDNLAALRILDQEAKVQSDAVAAADQSVRLFTNQYKAGTISYLEVVTAQTVLLTNQRTAVTILGQRMNASVLLVKALGGGWDASLLHDSKALGRTYQEDQQSAAAQARAPAK